MPTPIERAREAAWAAKSKLYAAGLRRDFTLRIRWVAEVVDELSMDPDATAEPTPDPADVLVIPAPDVKVYSGFAMLAIQQSMGGNVEVGDHRLRFPRAKVVEDFLTAIRDPSTQPGALYPEMHRMLFEVNGADCRPVRWLPGTINLDVYVRTIAR